MHPKGACEKEEIEACTESLYEAYDTIKTGNYGEHMNWIILLLLFGCGCGNGCGSCGNSCGNSRGGCGSNGGCGCNSGCGNGNNSSCNNRPSCRCERAREATREAREDAREALRDVREAREREQAVCDGPGMVPPPWQDYPPMPRRGEDRRGEERRDSDCGCGRN